VQLDFNLIIFNTMTIACPTATVPELTETGAKVYIKSKERKKVLII